MIDITPQEIDLFSRYIYDISGIQIDANKGYLLESRFQSLLASCGCQSYTELYHRARADQSASLMNQIIDAITTNETYFFRDNRPFELLANKIIPDLIDLRRRETGSARLSLRIWSAACSTGQEIYSIGITLIELLKNLNQYNISILGTDISDQVIAKASYGEYNTFEIERGLPKPYLTKYFNKSPKGWRIKDEVRTLARFEKRDLTKPFSELGKFDVIFCRNVAIYFSQANKIQLFKKLAHSLAPGGSLIVGASETLSGIATDFEAKHYLKSLFYQLKGDSSAGAKTVSAPAGRPGGFDAAETLLTKPRADNPRQSPQPLPALKDRVPETGGYRPPPVAAGTVSKHLEPAPVLRPVISSDRSKPESASGPLKPPPAIVATPTVAVAATGDKRSLLASLHRGKQTRPSLLSTIGNNEGLPKPSLLQKIRQKPDDEKPDKD